MARQTDRHIEELMSVPPSTESEVRRELLRLSMRNSARSVPALLIVVGFIAVLGQQIGRPFAAMRSWRSDWGSRAFESR